MPNKANTSANQKIETFLLKNRKVILCIAIFVILIAVIVCVSVSVSDSSKRKALSEIDSIGYDFTSNSLDLSETEIASRQEKALERIKPFLSKKGVAGVRANMFAAEVSFQKKDYSNALAFYSAAAEKSKKAYTRSICFYNAAVCAEEIGDFENAVIFYDRAGEDKDFYLSSHAVFSSGRASEEEGNYEDARKRYQNAIDFYDDEWANLSQSRLIDLRAKGKID